MRVEALKELGEMDVNLTLTKGYLGSLLGNAKVVSYLAQNYSDILAQFQKIADISSLAKRRRHNGCPPRSPSRPKTSLEGYERRNRYRGPRPFKRWDRGRSRPAMVGHGAIAAVGMAANPHDGHQGWLDYCQRTGVIR